MTRYTNKEQNLVKSESKDGLNIVGPSRIGLDFNIERVPNF